MMSNLQYTEQQKEAIAFNGSMVITACPGSGKTTVMTEKIKIAESVLMRHQGIIAITFTVKASEEIVKRCKGNSNQVAQSFYGTIDKFCLNEIIFPFISHVWGGDPHSCTVTKNFDEETNSKFQTECDGKFLKDWFEQEIDVFKQLYLSGCIVLKSAASIALFILENCQAARNYFCSKYTHIFVDEYQDSSQAQHFLFGELVSLGLVGVAVGDVNQSIYKFRGSDPEYLHELVRKDNFKHLVIDINHRSHNSIKNYAERLLNPNADLLDVDSIRVYRRKLNGSVTQASDTICSWIKDWIKDGAIKQHSDIAILAKRENSLLMFREGASLPCRTYIDTPLDKIDSVTSNLLSDTLSYYGGVVSSYQEIIEKYLLSFDKRTFREKAREVSKLLNSLRNEKNSEQLVKKLIKIVEACDLALEQKELEAVQNILNDPSLLDLFKPTNHTELQLMTLHKSKGLEFDIVFHLDMEEWSFPHQIYTGDWNAPPQYSDIVQETNLHYVGITRAKSSCILIQCEKRLNSKGQFSNSNPSFFLSLPQLEGLYS